MNFDYIKSLQDYEKLYKYCNNAESFVLSNCEISAISCRQALEFIVKTFYMQQVGFVPENSTLADLIKDYRFSSCVDKAMLESIRFVRKIGNAAAHGEQINQKNIVLALESLSYIVGEFLMFMEVVQHYPKFDKSILSNVTQNPLPEKNINEEVQVKSAPKKVKIIVKKKIKTPLDFTESETRSLYIDMALKEAGWNVLQTKGAIKPGFACVEIKVNGMPNAEGVGYVDYVLYDDDNKPLAVVEAKKTSVDPVRGLEQAKLYAQCIKAQFGYEPVIFYTNGYEYNLIDGVGGPSRKVYGFYTKEELHSIIIRRSIMKISDTKINPLISDRYFIQQAATNVCETFNNFRRKALVVMATGTGKTRCAISIVDVLQKANWAKRVLFLADRTALVNQAKNAFVNHLPSSTLCVLSDNKTERNFDAKVTLSTYQTIINLIDCDDKKFGIASFDLIIVDECHRSIYNKYKAIFNYFDSLVLGLTATPREQIDSSTYDIFNLPEGEPTFYYDYKTAVSEGYLVDFHPFERTTSLLKNGLKYSDLKDEQKKEFENLFIDEQGNTPEKVEGNAFFSSVINKDTIDLVLNTLMTEGLRVHNGEKLGKSIIFAVSHVHAQFIVERFKELYPEFGENFCVLIDNQVNYAQSLIDKFGIKDGEPTIAVSVDMLDTGIDVPEVLNLVFFKRVYSKIKFWQMIGRGTRVCKELNVLSPSKDYFDGKGQSEISTVENFENKQGFYIFDFCDVFEFFEMNPDGKVPKTAKNITQRIFDLKLDTLFELQKFEHQEIEEHKSYYLKYKDELFTLIKNLNRNLINVKSNLRLVDKYSQTVTWESISEFQIKEIKSSITPLIESKDDDDTSKVFDLWLFNMEFAEIVGDKDYSKASSTVIDICNNLLDKLTIPAVNAKKDFIKECTTSEFWKVLNITKLEKVRIELRDLIKFLAKEKQGIKLSNFADYVIEKSSGSGVTLTFKNYKQKILDYLTQNNDSPIITKIKNLEPLNSDDIKELENVLCNQLGNKDDFEREAKGLSVSVYIRQIVGMDNEVINQKLSQWFSQYNFNSQQQDFIKEIVNFVRQNGDINFENLSVSNPFMNMDYTEIFDDTEPLYNIISIFHNCVAA